MNEVEKCILELEAMSTRIIQLRSQESNENKCDWFTGAILSIECVIDDLQVIIDWDQNNEPS